MNKGEYGREENMAEYCICGSVRGVGGIDSWGSDVEDPYRISAQRILSMSL